MNNKSIKFKVGDKVKVLSIPWGYTCPRIENDIKGVRKVTSIELRGVFIDSFGYEQDRGMDTYIAIDELNILKIVESK